MISRFLAFLCILGASPTAFGFLASRAPITPLMRRGSLTTVDVKTRWSTQPQTNQKINFLPADSSLLQSRENTALYAVRIINITDTEHQISRALNNAAVRTSQTVAETTSKAHKVWQTYSSLLDKAPGATTAFTTAAAVGLGDLLVQTALEGGIEGIDTQATATKAAIALVQGFLAYHFYRGLDYFIPGRRPTDIILKTFIDQLSFFKSMGANFLAWTPGYTLQPAIRAEATLLVPALHALSFWLVPARFRVPFLSAVHVGLAAYLSRLVVALKQLLD